jgi:RNA polymerase sigma-70 factor (ECF subfamily)
MNPARRRSKGVSEMMVAAATAAPAEAEIAFERLYRANRDDLYAYVAGLLRDRAAAEDVVAAAFERAYRKRRRFDPDRGTPRAWLFGIARNAALDELRRRRRQAPLVGEVGDPGASAPGEAEAGMTLRIAVRDALGSLLPRDRELVALKYFAGLSNAEIARVLDVSESNAGTLLHRALEKLREQMS